MEKDIINRFNQWFKYAVRDTDLIEELQKIEGNEYEIEDRFYRDLEFGTGGLRGVIGAGTNRMNYYTVARTTQGLADYIKRVDSIASVAISYDSRIKSYYFAKTAAEILSGNGIKCYIFSELTPTPMLSFAVRTLSCNAGIVITASHNHAKFNGYKVYGSDGCQITLNAAESILADINKLHYFNCIKTLDFDDALGKSLITYIDESIINDYFMNVTMQSIYPGICKNSGLRVVYTPLNGTGNKQVQRVLKEIGIKDVIVVPEQENADGNFPTCPNPNPEIEEALSLGLKLCNEVKPDLLLATDPDCDRVGIAVPNGNNYELFSGNEVGAMLLEYICRERKANGTLPNNAVAIKTIVTTEIASKIAAKYGVEVINVLTGFKFIGEQIGEMEKKDELERFIFGFEESYGYLVGSYVRDKDAIVASMLICEMAAFYRLKGISLIEVRNAMYEEYGYYHHESESIAFEGTYGVYKMKEIMNKIRTSCPKAIAGYNVISLIDYLEGIAELPRVDVIKLNLSDGISIVIRPSGTEPKLKNYYTCIGESYNEAMEVQKAVANEFREFLDLRQFTKNTHQQS